MKAIYRILVAPFRSAVILAATLGGLLAIFSGFAVSTKNVDHSVGSIPLNIILALVTLALTFLPSLYFRLYSYARISSVSDESYNPDRLKLVGVIGLVFEAIVFIFLTNAYMAAITDGGVGTLGILAITLLNTFAMAVWGVIALVLNFRRSTYIPGQKTVKHF